jgi:hypothetical protein
MVSNSWSIQLELMVTRHGYTRKSVGLVFLFVAPLEGNERKAKCIPLSVLIFFFFGEKLLMLSVWAIV